MIGLFLGLGLPWGFGWLACRHLLPTTLSHRQLLCIAIGWVLGTGASGCLLSSWLFLGGTAGMTYRLADSAIFIGAIAFLWLTAPAPTPAQIPNELSSRTTRWLPLLLIVNLSLGVAAFISIAGDMPHGQWDARKIWNVRARFLYRAGPAWQDGFSPRLDESHPAYPAWLPAQVARLWLYAGDETTYAPQALAGLSALFLVLLLTALAGTLFGNNAGWIAGLFLASTPFLWKHAPWQYADVPLAVFFLGALGSAWIALDRKDASGPALLSGFCAGFAAWTKNEGALFVLILSLLLGWRLWRQTASDTRLRRAIFFLVGLVPGVILLVVFKATLAPPTDLVAAQNMDATSQKLLDPMRYATIAWWFLKEGVTFGKGLPVLLVLLCLTRRKKANPSDANTRMGGFVIALMLTGYFVVYLTTPLELVFHLNTSLERLLLQLWPLAILTAAQHVRSIDVNRTQNSMANSYLA